MPATTIEGIRKPVAALYPSDVGLRCVEVIIPDDEGYLWILAAFVAILGNDWSWLGTKTDRQTRAQLWQTAYAATLWDLCMQCEQLQECLQPFFDAIELRFDALDAAVDAVNQTTQQIQQTQQRNGATPTELPESGTTSATYAGALALVQAMNRKNVELYAEAEASFVDNAAEWSGQILDIFPNFSAQGVGAGADLANAYFQNQVDTYNAEYPDFEEPAACDLACRIDSSGGKLTYDIWGDWLFEITALFEPDGNAAANVYTKYSPLRQTFLNQLAEFFNQEASLQSYFDDLWNAYYTGSTNPITNPCGDCDFCRFSDFDDTLEPDGWVTFNGGDGNQSILLPQGWVNTPEVPSRVTIERFTDMPADLTRITVVISEGFTGGIGANGNTLTIYNDLVELEVQTINDTDTVYVFETPFTSDRIMVDVVYDSASVAGRPVPASILSVTLEGVGINRYGGNNC